MSHVSTPFEWGTSDCCRFVASCVETRTGTNPLPWDYKTEAEAEALIEAHGSLANAISALLGPPRDDEPQDGDVAMIRSGRDVAAYIEHGRAIVKTPTGISDLSLQRVLLHWRP